jgi:hypothetical protein
MLALLFIRKPEIISAWKISMRVQHCTTVSHSRSQCHRPLVIRQSVQNSHRAWRDEIDCLSRAE